MIVKTAHTRLPKKFLEQKMADFPGGTWIVMEGRAEKEEVDEHEDQNHAHIPHLLL